MDIAKCSNAVRIWSGQTPAPSTLIHSKYGDHSFPPHVHEEFTLGFIERGMQAYSFERKKSLIIPSGAICLINPGQVHAGSPGIEDGWSQRVISISPENLNNCLKNDLDSEVYLNVRFHDNVFFDKQILAALLKAHIGSESVEITTLEKGATLIEAFELLVNKYASIETAPLLKNVHPRSIIRTREYIDAFYQNNPSLEELAAVAELSPFYLLRVFKEHIGLAPHAYLIQRRVESVRLQVLKGCSLKEIAKSLGYSDQAHLSREFKKFYGVPPSKFSTR